MNGYAGRAAKLKAEKNRSKKVKSTTKERIDIKIRIFHVVSHIIRWNLFLLFFCWRQLRIRSIIRTYSSGSYLSINLH